MLQTLDPFEEMRFTRERFPTLSDADVLRMGLDPGWTALGAAAPEAWLGVDPVGATPPTPSSGRLHESRGEVTGPDPSTPKPSF